MPYLGSSPTTSSVALAKQDFTTSATTSYTLANSVTSANDIALFINNVRQEPTYAYSASGTALTLTAATTSSDDMYCVYLGRAVGTINPASGSVGVGELSATGTKNSTTFLRGDNTFATPSGGAYETALLHVRQEESSGGGSGSMSTSAWNTRTLNTVMTNEITSASLSSNQITLPSGTYYIYAYGLGYACTKHQTKLYNTTDASDVLLGNSSMAHATYGQNTHSIVSGRFTISAQKVFELQSKSSSARATNGMGVHAGLGTEVYTDANIWKVG
jgi:hypothetical protein